MDPAVGVYTPVKMQLGIVHCRMTLGLNFRTPCRASMLQQIANRITAACNSISLIAWTTAARFTTRKKSPMKYNCAA